MNMNKIVSKVVDGDTINVEPFPDGEDSIRLLGIDTPETNYHGHSQGAHAEAASAFLKQQIKPGDTVTIETDFEERDKYGRVLAYVIKDDINMNIKLVAEGMAVPYQIYPNLKFIGKINQAAVDSRNAELGIWDPNSPLDELPFVFRMRVDHRPPSKFVGDFRTQFYHYPSEYNQIPLENRVFFFKETDAKTAGYKMYPRQIILKDIVNKSYENLGLVELLDAQVYALKGVSEGDAQRLKEAFNIETIQDLAENKYFKRAQAINNLVK